MGITEGVPRCCRRVSFAPQISKRYEEELLVGIVLQSGQLGLLAAHFFRIEAVCVEGLTHSSVVRDVLAQRQFAIDLKENKVNIVLYAQ